MLGSKIFMFPCLLQLAAFGAASFNAGQADESMACSISAAAPLQPGVSMLQHSPSNSAEFSQAEHLEAVGSRSPELGTDHAAMSQTAAHSLGEGAPGGKSIFTLKIHELDSEPYNIILASMIFFTIIVDRTQTWMSEMATTSVVETRLLNRLQAELMMFGVVGLTIFVITNIGLDLNPYYVLYITHVDIYASLAAVLMMVFSVMLYFMNRVSMPFLADLETKRDACTPRTSEGEESSPARKPSKFHIWGQASYNTVAASFTKEHALPEGVRYIDYLSECYILNACDIMDIHWTSWLVIFCLSLFNEVELHFRPEREKSITDLSYYVDVYAGTNWLFFVCNLVMLFDVRSSYQKMITYLEALDKNVEVKFENPMPGQMPDRIKHGMQIITLCNSFQLALFVMTWLYNLAKRGALWWQYVIMLLPCILNTCVLLPWMIFEFTIVESYYDPNQEALDTLYEKYDRLEDDLNYLGRLYERKGRPNIPGIDSGCNEEQLTKVIRGLGLHISSTRMKRIFKSLDADGDGEVDSKEFFSKITLAATTDSIKLQRQRLSTQAS